MADQEQAKASAFPAPPSYYTHFTAANREHLLSLKREANFEQGSAADHTLSDLVDLPKQLQSLVPPKPPGPQESWCVFGEHKTLPPHDLPYLDPATPLLHSLPPSPASIVRLARGALLAFLEISHILACDPTPDRRFGTKWEDLRDLLLNAHRAVNLYRPWAAREQLIRTLEGYVADARAEAAHVDDLNGRVDTLLKDLAANDGVIIPPAAPSAISTVSINESAIKLPGVINSEQSQDTEKVGNVDDQQASWHMLSDAME